MIAFGEAHRQAGFQLAESTASLAAFRSYFWMDYWPLVGIVHDFLPQNNLQMKCYISGKLPSYFADINA